jgi:hypothetical protein
MAHLNKKQYEFVDRLYNDPTRKPFPFTRNELLVWTGSEHFSVYCGEPVESTYGLPTRASNL